MISIILPLYNDEKYVTNAISSLLKQTYKDFELIIINDDSTDNSLNAVKEFQDARIKVYSHKKNLGVSICRNKGIDLSKGKYIFFTDSDCIADKNWILYGLKTFKENDCSCVEGKTFYVKKGYLPSISDKTPGSIDKDGEYLGCNIAFTKDVFKKLGKYDGRYRYHEDRELAHRFLKHGKIVRNNNMIITHQKKLWTMKSFIQSGKRAAYRVPIFKKYGDKSYIHFRILFPRDLIKILIPPLIILPLFKHKNNTLLDYKIVLCSYIKCIYERILIWKMAIREKVFVI